MRQSLSRSSSAEREDAKVARLTRELSDTRQQQTATSEILGVISRFNFKLQSRPGKCRGNSNATLPAEQAVIYRQQNGIYRFAGGHSWIKAGDVLEIEAASIGVLRNRNRAAAPPMSLNGRRPLRETKRLRPF